MRPKRGSILYFYQIDEYGESNAHVYLVVASLMPGIISQVTECIVKEMELAPVSKSKRRIQGVVLERDKIEPLVGLMGKRLYGDYYAFSFLVVEEG